MLCHFRRLVVDLHRGLNEDHVRQVPASILPRRGQQPWETARSARRGRWRGLRRRRTDGLSEGWRIGQRIPIQGMDPPAREPPCVGRERRPTALISQEARDRDGEYVNWLTHAKNAMLQDGSRRAAQTHTRTGRPARLTSRSRIHPSRDRSRPTDQHKRDWCKRRRFD